MKSILKKTLFSLMFICLLFLCVSVTNVKAADESTGETTSQTYVKVKNALSDYSGTYLIVCEDDKVIFDGSLSTLDVALNKQSVTINSDTITGDYSKYTFEISQVTGGYSIKSASGYYIGQTATTNGLKVSGTPSYCNTISFSDDVVKITSSGGPVLQYYSNNNSSRFRFYRTNQKAISLYKLNSIEPAINLSVSNLNMSVGSIQNVTVATKNFTGTPTVTFSVSDQTVASVAKVEDAYQVTGLVKGTTTVKFTATYGEETAEETCTVSVFPSNAKCLSVAEALELCNEYGTTGTGIEYTVRGYVKDFDQYYSYSSSVNFYLVDQIDDDKSLKIFGLSVGSVEEASTIQNGNFLYVTGKLKVYNSTNEMERPQTYVNVSNKLNSCESYFSLAYQYNNNDGVLSNSEFRFRLGVTNELSSLLTNVKADSKEYGLKVSTADKTEYYAFNEETLKADSVLYMILSLGDIINDQDKLETEFTVCAYVKVDGVTIDSGNTKTYSVKTLVEEYYDLSETKDLVTPLYNLLNKDN